MHGAGEIFGIIAMLGAAAALILFFDWIGRNLGEAVGKSAAGESRGGGSDAGPTADEKHTLTRPYRTLDKRTFNR